MTALRRRLLGRWAWTWTTGAIRVLQVDAGRVFGSDGRQRFYVGVRLLTGLIDAGALRYVGR